MFGRMIAASLVELVTDLTLQEDHNTPITWLPDVAHRYCNIFVIIDGKELGCICFRYTNQGNTTLMFPNWDILSVLGKYIIREL
jgi:hypothetical protein